MKRDYFRHENILMKRKGGKLLYLTRMFFRVVMWKGRGAVTAYGWLEKRGNYFIKLRLTYFVFTYYVLFMYNLCTGDLQLGRSSWYCYQRNRQNFKYFCNFYKVLIINLFVLLYTEQCTVCPIINDNQNLRNLKEINKIHVSVKVIKTIIWQFYKNVVWMNSFKKSFL